jgi:hypothetical protein
MATGEITPEMEALLAKASTPERKDLVVEAYKLGVRDEKLTNKAIKEGKYFAPIDKIWSPKPFKFDKNKAANGDAFKEFGRTRGHWKNVKMYHGLGALTSNKMLSPNFDNKTKKKVTKRGGQGWFPTQNQRDQARGMHLALQQVVHQRKLRALFESFMLRAKNRVPVRILFPRHHLANVSTELWDKPFLVYTQKKRRNFFLQEMTVFWLLNNWRAGSKIRIWWPVAWWIWP